MLYTPADDREMMRSALGSEADAVIFDLEDAVPHSGLEDARGNVVTIAEGVDETERQTERCVRINGIGTEEWLADLRAVAGAVDTVILPKVESAEELATAARAAERSAAVPPELVITLETPQGLFSAADVASRASGIEAATALSFGLEDYARAIGTTERPPSVREFVSVTVTSAAAVGGLDALYTVYTDYEDTQALRETARRARDLGYLGMKAIHPRQVPVINEVFTPTDEEVERARRFVEAFEESERDSLSVDGTFLDAAVVEQYRSTLARHRAVAEFEE